MTGGFSEIIGRVVDRWNHSYLREFSGLSVIIDKNSLFIRITFNQCHSSLWCI
jgi:hypothetical protein